MSPEKEESKRRGRVLSSHWARVHQSITEEPVEKQGVLAILPHRWGLNRGEGTQPCGQSRDWTTGSRFPSQSCFPAPPRKGRQAGADLPDQRRCHQGGGRVRCAMDRDWSLYRAQPGSSRGWEPCGSVRSLLLGALPHSGGWATPRRVCSAFPNRTPRHIAPPRIFP